MSPPAVVLAARDPVAEAELDALFAVAWPGRGPSAFGPVLARSLTWVTARSGPALVGFVNVATDGGVHAFLLDTTVHPQFRRRGLGRRLVAAATTEARARGAHWLHVDFAPHLTDFYAGCGFAPTAAALLDLGAPVVSSRRGVVP